MKTTVAYSERYQAWTIIEAGRQAFVDGVPLVFSTREAAEEYAR